MNPLVDLPVAYSFEVEFVMLPDLFLDTCLQIILDGHSFALVLITD